MTIENKPQPYEEEVNYFDTYWQVYNNNEHLLKALVDFVMERNLMLKKIIKIEVRH